MIIATWNVNSIRARLPRVTDWLAKVRPDVLCMQETKVTDEEFPREEIEALGYRLETYGQPTYNGVAIASLHEMEEVARGLPEDDDDSQRRVIEATVKGVRIVNVYVPNGQAPGTEAYEMKLQWLATLCAALEEFYYPSDDLVLLGDMNIAPEDRDVHDPEALRGKIHVSEPERAALRSLIDALRQKNQDDGVYTWWDYRMAMFRRGLGYRIDLILVTPPLSERLLGVTVDRDERAQEKPSDHAPVIATFA